MRSHLFLFLLSFIGILSTRTALAQVVAPSQGGEVGLVLVTATTMELTFGITGNGQGRVVAMAPTSSGMPVPLSAVDGTFYTGASLYGQGSPLKQGYVIYSGIGHSTTVTGLKPNTYYYITSAEYNTDGISISYNNRSSSISTSTRASTLAVAPLPVELISFTGTLDSHNVVTLRWSTATEHNTAYFALERSLDGVTFTEVSRVAAAGTSTQSLSYHWSDPQPLAMTTYYRLRQVDYDGAAQYSSSVALTPSIQIARNIDVYPNPSTNSTLHLLVQGYEKETLKLLLTNALGQMIQVQTLTPVATHYLTSLALPEELASGTYFLTICNNNDSIQKRIVIKN